MTFVRRPSDVWHREAPGARWFKADLHVHTVDDHLGGRARWPAEIPGDPDDPSRLRQYARLVLRAAIAAGVHVLGLTPHSPRAGAGPETSSVWHVVDAWNDDDDDDGTPFRDKIFAVFPGFEPCVNEGRTGVHLLFLFDPELGREAYLDLFAAVMAGQAPYDGSGLRMTRLDARAVLKTLDDQCDRSGDAWSYLVLAPHFYSDNGLLASAKGQVLAELPYRRIAGYELGDDKLPDDYPEDRKPGSFLRPSMRENHQAFFHASDAYGLHDGGSGEHGIGFRHTWVKLASARVEALRQAFLASESRLRLAYERGDDGRLWEVSAPLFPPLYPWLRSVTVAGEAAFFGGLAGQEQTPTTFDLSPDLTCLIGGSMTGKSTFLDGLRVYLGLELPKDERLTGEVIARGRDRFFAGSPEVRLGCPGSDSTAPPGEQWPAQFFTQGELQRLSADPAAVEDILARLNPDESSAISEERARLARLDADLRRLAAELGRLDDELGESDQAHQRALAAKKALDAFAEAGVERMHVIAGMREVWKGAAAEGAEVARSATELLEAARALPALALDDQTARAAGLPAGPESAASPAEVVRGLEAVVDSSRGWVEVVARVADALAALEERSRRQVEQTLAARGLDAQRLREFEALSQQANLQPSFESNLVRVRDRHASAVRRFEAMRAERRDSLCRLRGAFDRVADRLIGELGGRVRVRRGNGGDSRALQEFLAGLKERGVTRWWSSQSEPTPGAGGVTADALLDAVEGGTLDRIGMSDAVASTFTEAMTRKRRRELAALRSPDLYWLELEVAEGEYRHIRELSGGQRVSLLLSLLLETQDDRPLVVDQPEDELDNRFLWDTVLPALRRLKGRRQVIVATHNANIVVNGDADQVILLEADAHHGRVAAAGAIEDPAVRQAIVATVDGGHDAFLLRKLKYGF